MTSEEYEYLWNKRHSVIARAEISSLYHQKRERFFELCDKLGKAVSVIGGSAAVWKIKNNALVEYLAILITVTSTMSLVFGFSEKSKRHAELSRKYKAVIADIAGIGERNFTEDNINSWEEKIRVIEVEEPPALSALVRLCQNELAHAANDKKAIIKLSFYERLFAHFLDMPVKSV